MAKISNEKKLEAMKVWLKENNISFLENHVSQYGVIIDLKIPDLRIAVFLSNGDRKFEEERYFARNKRGHILFQFYRAFFIRPTDTKAFTLEKIKNCCFDRMLYMQKIYMRQMEAKKKEAAK